MVKIRKTISKNYKLKFHKLVTFRNHIISISLSIFFFSASLAQTKIDEIKFIRKEANTINTDKTLKKVTLENEEFSENLSDGGGELSGLYKDGEVKKVIQWIGLSNGVEITEFYFTKGDLIFVYEKFNSFIYDKKKDQIDFSKSENRFQGRYYFKNNKLINLITSGHKRFEETETNHSKTILKDAYDNLKLLQIKINLSYNQKLIKGHWVSLDDKKSHIIFTDTLMYDLYNNVTVDTSSYRIGNDDNLFSKGISDEIILKYAILSLSKTNLTLLSLEKGNILKFKRKKSNVYYK